MKVFKQILALVLMLGIALGVTPSLATEIVSSGNCGANGDNLTWMLTEDGTLTITGDGAMNDYDDYNFRSTAPWNDYTNVKTVIIMDSVTTIGNYAFSDCDSLVSITLGSSVTTIGDHAFRSCNSLTNITIPDSVATIGGCAFYNCKNLVSITIGNSVTTIGNSAFFGCNSLARITLGSSVTTISDQAFSNCWSLTNITIPDSVTTIGNYAFSDCDSLVSITLGSSVTTIGNHAFRSCNSLTNITIPDSVGTIGDYAFYACDALTRITIPNSVTTIGNFALSNCSRLAEINVGEKNTVYSSDEGILFNKAQTAILCYPTGKDIRYYHIPNSVTTIGDYAFAFCYGLESISIPNSVNMIGSAAFYDCYNLKELDVDINNTVYSSIEGILFNKTQTAILCYPAGKNIRYYHIPNSVTTIGDYAFSYGRIENITIPNSVTTIGDHAFYSCCYLTSITMPNSVTTIGNSAFSHCDTLTNITIPNSVTTIGDDAFSFCDALTNLTIPNSVTTIGDYAFFGCDSLASITIGNGVTTIGDSVFCFCYRLASVTLGSGVTTIGDSAFSWCGITNILIPDSVTTIGYSAFSGCERLASITIGNSVIMIGNSAFYYCKSLSDVYYSGSERDWKKIDIDDGNECLLNANIHYNGAENIRLVNVSPDYCCSEADRDITIELTFNKKIRDFNENAIKLMKYSGSQSDEKPVVSDDDKAVEIRVEVSAKDSTTICIEPKDVLEKNTFYYLKMEPYSIISYDIEHFEGLTCNPNEVPEYYFKTNGKTVGYLEWGEFSVKWDEELQDIFKYDPSSSSFAGTSEWKKLAMLSGILSGNIYGDDFSRITKKLEALDMSVTGYNETSGIDTPGYIFANTQIVCGGKQTTLILAVFRGTNGPIDWVTDLTQALGGINIAANKSYDKFQTYLKNIRKSGVSTDNAVYLVAGHSLGGAMANVFAAKLNNDVGSSNVFAYTFASPKTNLDFLDDNARSNNISNFVSATDIVTHVGVKVAIVAGHYGRIYYVDTPASMPFAESHALTSYLKCVREIEGTGRKADFVLRALYVRCPVDVELLDESGNVLGRIINNKVTDDTVVPACVIGDDKFFCFECEGDYVVKILGTDTGTMDYAVFEIDAQTENITESKEWTNVELYDGKMMRSEVYLDTDTSMLFLEDETGIIGEINQDGTETLYSTYTVTFVDWDGTELKSEVVAEGESATAPEDPIRTDWLFIGWDKDFTNVTEDMIVTAQYWRLGDVNDNGMIDSGDATLVLRVVVGTIEFSDKQIIIADKNKNAQVDSGDATLILRVVVGLAA